MKKKVEGRGLDRRHSLPGSIVVSWGVDLDTQGCCPRIDLLLAMVFV